jgi:hypothetical protein
MSSGLFWKLTIVSNLILGPPIMMIGIMKWEDKGCCGGEFSAIRMSTVSFFLYAASAMLANRASCPNGKRQLLKEE